MNILHAVQGYTPAIGGTEFLIQNVSEKLVSRHGDRVTVFTTAARYNCEVFTNPFIRQLRPGIETINGVTVRRFRVFNWLGPFLFFVQAAACKLNLPRNDRLRALYSGPIVFDMAREMARFPADVMAASSFPLLHMHYTVAAKKKSGVPVVLIGGLHPQEPWAFDQQIIFEAIHQADACIAYTGYERDYLLGKGIEAEKIHVIGVGVEPVAFAHADGGRIRQRYGLGDDPVVAFIGQHAGHKGIDTLILAMPAVWREFPSARLLIAGNPTRFTAVIRWRISELPPEYRQRVVMIDNFPESDKPDLFDACDVFAYPSGFESFGIAYLEAWIRARPVIGCRAGAVPSVIDEGQDGLLARYEDTDELARAIIILLQNPALRHDMGQRGREKTLSRYTWDMVSDRFRGVYQEVVSRSLSNRSTHVHAN